MFEDIKKFKIKAKITNCTFKQDLFQQHKYKNVECFLNWKINNEELERKQFTGVDKYEVDDKPTISNPKVTRKQILFI